MAHSTYPAHTTSTDEIQPAVEQNRGGPHEQWGGEEGDGAAWAGWGKEGATWGLGRSGRGREGGRVGRGEIF